MRATRALSRTAKIEGDSEPRRFVKFVGYPHALRSYRSMRPLRFSLRLLFLGTTLVALALHNRVKVLTLIIVTKVLKIG